MTRNRGQETRDRKSRTKQKHHRSPGGDRRCLDSRRIGRGGLASKNTRRLTTAARTVRSNQRSPDCALRSRQSRGIAERSTDSVADATARGCCATPTGGDRPAVSDDATTSGDRHASDSPTVGDRVVRRSKAPTCRTMFPPDLPVSERRGHPGSRPRQGDPAAEEPPSDRGIPPARGPSRPAREADSRRHGLRVRPVGVARRLRRTVGAGCPDRRLRAPEALRRSNRRATR